MIGIDASRRWALDLGITAAAVIPPLIDQATTDTSAGGWLTLGGYCGVAVTALSQRRRWPVPAFVAILLALAIAQVWGAAEEISISSLSVLALAFALYAVGAYTSTATSIYVIVTAAAVVGVGLLINNVTAPDGWRGGSDVLATVSTLPVAWALGVVARSHRELLAAAERRVEDALREQHLLIEQAGQAERVRIARDMHDLVAHSLTLLVVHAETLRARAADLPSWVRPEIDGMAAAGRQATVEMRDLLGILRDGSDPVAPRSPAPTLSALPALVDAGRAAGNPIEITVVGEPDLVPRPVQLAGYRVVQESLANARRHAPGAAVEIRVEITATRALFDIYCAPPRGGTVASSGGMRLGLAGMRERLTALGGEVCSGPADDGGFRVEATLPLERTRGEAHAQAG